MSALTGDGTGVCDNPSVYVVMGVFKSILQRCRKLRKLLPIKFFFFT